MIDINLVPKHLIKKKKKKVGSSHFSALPKGVVIGLVVGVVTLLLSVHVFFQFLITMKVVQLKKYNQEKKEIVPAKANVDKILENLKVMREKVKNVKDIVWIGDLLWAETLNVISDSLPRGVWLSRLAFEDDILIIQGTAVSSNKTEMINVHNFNSNLKRNDVFKNNFENVDLGLIKSRKINATLVADFTITADFKK